MLNATARNPVDGLRYFRVMDNRIADVDIHVSRTGYTGDLGFELWVPAHGALAVWDALMAAGRDYGIMPRASGRSTSRGSKRGSSCWTSTIIPLIAP